MRSPALLALALSCATSLACGERRASLDGEALIYGEVADESWRVDLASGRAEALELELVASLDEVHEPAALHGRTLVDGHGHAFALADTGRVVSISPDRRHVVVGDWRPEGGGGELRLLADPGGSKVVHALAADLEHSWAASGELVASQSEGGVVELLAWTPERNEVRVLGSLTPGYTGVEGLREAPDGAWWVRTRHRSEAASEQSGHRGAALLRFDPETGATVEVHSLRDNTYFMVDDPIFPPDGSAALFVSSAANDCQNGDLWRADLDGGGAERIIEFSCGYFRPEQGILLGWQQVRPDGRIIGLAATRDDCSPSLGTNSSSCRGELHLIDPAAGELRPITDMELWITRPWFKGRLTLL